MIIELFIYSDSEVYKIEIDDFELSTVFSTENIKNIESRKDNVTKDITIKATKSNKQAFSFLENLSRFSATESSKELGVFFQPNRQVDCKLFANNIQIMKGKLVVNNIEMINDVSTYNCSITGNVVSFFKNLSERYLHELDSITLFSNLISIYDMPDIINSWQNDNGVWFYPQIDYGVENRTGDYDTYDNSFQLNNYRPAFYVKTYLDAIFKGFKFNDTTQKYTQLDENNNSLDEYKYRFDEFNDTLGKAFIPANDELFTQKTTGEWTTLYYYDVANMTQVGSEALVGLSNKMYGITPNKYLSKYTVNNWQIYNKNGITVKINELEKLQITDNYLKTTVNFSTTVTVPKGATGTWLIGLADISGDNTLSSSSFKFYQKINKSQTATAQVYNINYTSDIENIAGEYVFAYYRENQNLQNATNDTGFLMENIKIIYGKANVENEFLVSLYDYVNAFNYIPKDVKIIDFLKSLMTMFNLYLSEDNDMENSFVIETYNHFYKNIVSFDVANAVDWSNKTDWSNYKLSTNIALPKSYKYQFEEDDDIGNEFYRSRYNKGYGNYEIEDKNGIEDSQELKLIFASTVNINHSKDEKNIPIIYKADNFLASEKKPFNSKLRILYNNGTYYTIETYNTMSGNGVVMSNATLANYCSMIKVENNIITNSLFFNLPNEIFTSNHIPKNNNLTLFNKHYQYQVRELINSDLMILEIDVHLNELDINNLDFKNMVYLSNSKYGNAYWKLLEVDYKNNTTTSKVKLQKIIN